MEIDPHSLSIEQRYKLLIGSIIPRPIAWVSTVSPDNRTNLAPFSFFNGVSSNPMALLFCPANKPDGSMKDTLRNILASARDPSGVGGEFVVNIVPRALSRAMAACAEELPYGESEFEFAGLEPAPSRSVRPPRVARAPVALECRAIQVVRLAPAQPSGGNIVIGEVLWVYSDDEVIDASLRMDPARLDAIGRLAGISYCSTADRFDIPWGKAALGKG